MALLKDLIVQGASRFIGDAYFATIKEGVWNGTPIDLSHGGTAGTTTANQVLLSTSTSGTSTWGAQSSLSVGSASRLSGNSSYTAWGQTYWSNGVPSTISGDMTSVGNITPSANVSKDCGSSSNAWLNIYGNNIVSNTTLFLTSAASTSLVFKPQGTDRARFNQSGNFIIGLSGSTANNITDQLLYVNGNTTLNGAATLGSANTDQVEVKGYLNVSSISSASVNVSRPIWFSYAANSSSGYTVGRPAYHTSFTYNPSTGTVSATTFSGSLSGNATTSTYAANVGSAGTLHTNYITAAEVIAVYNWYATMIDENNDSDTLINRWKEVCDFLNNFTEADTLASVLSTYVTLGTAQTITGAKTFANPISGDLLGNATTADRLKSTTAVGGAGTPVYFTGGLPVACTASNVRTFLGLGTVYSHAHTDYVTNVSFNDTNRKLQQSKGGGTATDIVTFGTGAFATIADYLPLAGGTMTGSIIFPSDQAAAYNSSGIKWSDYTMIGSNTGDDMGIYSGNSVYIRPGTSTDYTKGIVISRTNLTYNGNEVLTAGNYTDYVNSTNFPVLGYTLSGVSGRTINAGTATQVAYYSDANTISSSDLIKIDTTDSVVNLGRSIVKYTTGNVLSVWKSADGSTPAIKFFNGVSANTLGSIGIAGSSATGVTTLKPFWNNGTTYYQIVYSTAKTAVGSSTTAPVYIDSNGQVQVCTSLNINTSGSAGSVKTVTRSTNATHYLTFVDSDNSTAAAESIYTDAGITYNPSTNLLTVEKLTASGVVNLSGTTTIDSLTAGDLLVTGNTSLSGNVSMGTVTAGTWNGSVIDVAHGGTGCSTLTSGSALIGNGTGAVTFKEIDTVVTVNSSNLITSGAVATYVTSTLGISSTITKTAITKSLNSSTWTETGYTLYGEEQGSYMLQITDTTTAAVFTGVFSVYNSSSATGNDLDEIPLHMCASATNKVRIYAATQNGKLLVSSQDASATDHVLTIKYKKIL